MVILSTVILPFGDENGKTDAGEVLGVFGTPLAFLVVD